jgi:hypothetical protein
MTDSGIRIALWEVNSENPNSPKFNGIVTIDGKEHKVSLWDNSAATHPKAPRLKGKTSRPSPKVEEESTITEIICVPMGTNLPF